MLVIRQRKNVVDNKVTVDVPNNFGDEVEVIILSNLDEQKSKEVTGQYNFEEKNWASLTVKEFLDGYSESDSIYDNYKK
ncbi:MAG: hypothetical protein M1495_21735 [Bacteroidetes bacterium]|nr:hypothetical protein [Bacteroidota bacterium]